MVQWHEYNILCHSLLSHVCRSKTVAIQTCIYSLFYYLSYVTRTNLRNKGSYMVSQLISFYFGLWNVRLFIYSFSGWKGGQLSINSCLIPLCIACPLSNVSKASFHHFKNILQKKNSNYIYILSFLNVL
jgi:hypothetical protein